jgi:hypothetical protein
MRVLTRAVVVLACLLIIPAVAYAQASLTGTAKDSSGAVLPGVTVEAASDVLIEKVRTTQTDGNGRFQLLDLRPGAYVVTFTLPGFSSHRRDGIELSGSGTVVVNADLRVGAVAETVTVTGETPIVDVRSVTRQNVLTSDVIDALPSSRNFVTLARMIPGTSGGGTDVGGSVLQDVGVALTVRGSNNNDTRITLNGISVMTLQAGGSLGGQQPDVGSAQEITVDTSSLSADLPTGGPRINFIPRDGGNRFSDSAFFNFSNSSLQGSNYSDALKAAGLATPNRIQSNWDLSESFGGPIRKDRVWFWASLHFNEVANEVAVLQNANAFDVTKWTYMPAEGQPGVNRGNVQQSSVRVTWQATPRNKIAGTYKVDKWCACPNFISATRAPEAAADRRFPRLRQEHVEWTSTVSNRLMVEAVGLHLFERWGNMDLREQGGSLESQAQEAAVRQLIGVVEQGTGADGLTPAGMTYRMWSTFNNTLVPNFAYRLGMTYITGSHAVKVGFNRTHGFLEQTTYNNQPFQYRFLNGVPNQITVYATPYTSISNEDNDLGLYVQDRWTMSRLTVNGALRFDYFGTSFPAQEIGPGLLLPNRNLSFPEQDNLGWKDLTYRSGFVYDVTGNGKTALRVSFNKYLLGQTLNGLGSSPSPANALVTQANRTWNDRGGLGINNDYVPQCNFLNPLANGECGATNPNTFGTAGGVLDTFDPDLLRGWGHRQMNYEFMAGLQHEILPRVSLDVGYFRRIWGNFQVTDNILVTAADYTQFSLTVPTDSRLPNSGTTVTGLYDVKLDKFAQVRNYNTLSDKFGNQIDHWNGFEVALNARLHNGLTLQGAVGSTKQIEDNCEIVAQLPEVLNTGTANAPVWRPAQNCHRESPFLTGFKGYAVYIVPRVGVQVAGTLRSTRGADYNANYVATNAYLAANSTLGRQLSAGANANMTVAVVPPNTLYLDRRNELDLRFGKVFKAGRARSIVSLDLYNALNTDKPITVNQAYASWLAPTAILNPRVAKISVQFDF